MKDLYEYIYKRKSSRKYLKEELSKEILSQIEEFVKKARPLYDDIKVEYEIVSETKNLFPVKAPHFFLIYSEEKEGYLENVGFIFQQVDLFLSSIGIGSCWIGMAKPTEKKVREDSFVIAIGFGRTPYPPYREIGEFKRKTTYEISNGFDERIEPARLAPSATNSQTWFFHAEEDLIHVYRKKFTPLEKVLYSKMSKIDTGIALAHIYVASSYHGKNFSFEKIDSGKVPKLKGLDYIGTVV